MQPRVDLKQTYAADLGSHMHEVFEKIAKGELTRDNWEEWSRPEQPKLHDLAAEKFPECENIPDQVMLDCRMIFDCLYKRDPIFNPLEDGCKIIGIEHKFEYDVAGVRIKGFMDLVREIDEETLEVYDYKTGKSAMGYDKARTDIQVLMYYMAARDHFPQYKYVIVTLDYLQKKPVTIPLDDKVRTKIERRLQAAWRRIKNCTSPARIKSETHWVCRCFCDRQECDRLWTIYQDVCGGDLDAFEKYLNSEIEE